MASLMATPMTLEAEEGTDQCDREVVGGGLGRQDWGLRGGDGRHGRRGRLGPRRQLRQQTATSPVESE